jgi:hypothetical protein
MSTGNLTAVRYFVLEADEYEEPKHPNIFRTTKAVEEIQVKDVKERFVDWKGGFHFYFKTKLQPSSSAEEWVWEDIQDENQIVPNYNGIVVVKAVRTGYKQFFEIKTREKDMSAQQPGWSFLSMYILTILFCIKVQV